MKIKLAFLWELCYTISIVSEKTRQEDWEKLIDEILEQGMDLVWNEKTEKYEKKDEVCTWLLG